MIDWQERAARVLPGIKQTANFPMAELTTFKIGGPIDRLLEPADEAELAEVLQFAAEEELPWLVVGLGSNLLVRDKGIRGIGIRLIGKFLEWNVEGETAISGAGVALSDLSRGTACRGLTGLEFACGIPGTVGGAVFMNAGAYDGDIAKVLTKAEAYYPGRGLAWLAAADLDFGYRHSRFQHETAVITRAAFDLRPVNQDDANSRITELTCQRESKQPLEWPSAGSVFRRPEGHYVGPLIEQAGLKGFRIGGAQVSPKHAGFIVNAGGATAADVLALIDHIRKVIRVQYGVELVPEIRVIGEE